LYPISREENLYYIWYSKQEIKHYILRESGINGMFGTYGIFNMGDPIRTLVESGIFLICFVVYK